MAERDERLLSDAVMMGELGRIAELWHFPLAAGRFAAPGNRFGLRCPRTDPAHRKPRYPYFEYLLSTLLLKTAFNGCLCRRVRRGLADLSEGVSIGVVERFGLTANDQNRVLLIGPGSIGMDRHGDGVTHGAERVFEEWVGNNPVGLRTTHGFEAE